MALSNSQLIARLTDAQALALTSLGEARGDAAQGGSSVEERLGMMMTARNRISASAARFGATYREACLRAKQYSCWNDGDPNRAYLVGLVETEQWVVQPLREALYLARGVIDFSIRDHTNGATHYYSPRSMVPAGTVPYWARGVRPCATVGSSLYFKGV